ncbi:hypothetical protein WA577_000588, partial [Blastocystis sp. JDR]
MKYLHERGIMHGDVRPVNLFLTEDGVLKLGYYGLTTQVDCYFIKEEDCDGVRSFAPEVFDVDYEMKSDVWSFGVTLIEMMGMTPYVKHENDDLPTMNAFFQLPCDEDDIESEELLDFLQKFFQEVDDRSSVNELLNHPFVKECEGGNEVLMGLVKILKNQEYCEWVLKKDVKDAYVALYRHDGLCWYNEGVIERTHSIVEEVCLNGVIEVDIASHTLLRVNGEEVSEIEHNRVLDLNDEGERWEGDVLSNEPYGWGVLYDSENRRVYEGFRIDDANVCYGRSFYSENQKVEYEGGICGGMRWGRGTQSDRNGNTVFEGEWMNNEQLSKRVVLNEENQLLHNHIEELIVENNSCNRKEWTALDLSFMSKLRLLKVGDECFENVKEVKLIELNRLERVVIGKNSFTKHKNDFPVFINTSRHFCLNNCWRLRELMIGCFSFSDYSVCEIENVPSLEVIEMGELKEDSYNFRYASLELKNLPSLKSLLFGIWTFEECSRVVFENLPELTSIRLGYSAFHFKDDDSSELTMRNLPKLTSLTTVKNSESFSLPCSITLEDIPSLTTVSLPHAFECRNQLSYKNIGKLMNHPCITKPNPHANVHSIDELEPMSQSVEVMIVDNNACNDMSYQLLDLSFISNLKVFEVGDYSIAFVEEVKLIGLNVLERVVIGKNSFTKYKYRWPKSNPDRHFYLKDCERLRELKIGCGSFSDYSVCEIENVPSLEVIEVGELNEGSDNFWYASLELKNLPSLKSLLLGKHSFHECSRVVFENLPELTSIRLGYSAFHFNYDDSSEVIIRNLPKLTSLTTVENSDTFENPRSITLEDMPSLTTVTLDKEYAFKCQKTIHT